MAEIPSSEPDFAPQQNPDKLVENIDTKAGLPLEKEVEAEETKSVLDEEPKKGEGETEVMAGETIAEKSAPDKAKKIREQIEEELRENPVSLSDEDIDNISKEVLQKHQSAILENLPKNVKDKYPDQATTEQARQKMLQSMADNKVVSKEEDRSFCNEGAFYKFLQQGYDAENIRLAGPLEIIKKAFFGVPVIQQIKILREIATKGELLILPKIDGHKNVVSLEDFKVMVEANDLGFNMDIQGKQEYAKRKILAEKEDAIVLSEIAQRLEAEEALKNQEVETEERVEKAEEIPGEEKQEKLKRAAILWNKTYKIDKALRRENFDNFKYKKISKAGEERIFEGEEAKKQAKNDKNAMSKELMALAQEISGKDFKEEAKNIQPKWKKRDLERFITEQVMAVLEGQVLNNKEIKFKRQKKK